jgi:DNA-binding response OmpR family regulator
MQYVGGGSSGQHILVVEDDEIIARLIERGFLRLGYDVQVVTSCAEARALTGSFRCGVFDIELGDGDGIELATRMLAKGYVRAVVFYTGSLDSDARRRAGEVGRVVDKLSPFSDLGGQVMELIDGKPVGNA